MVGQALIANVSRVMFTLGRLKAAAISLVGGQLLGAVISVPLVLMAPPRLTVAMVALGVTVGQLVTAVPMLLVMGRIRGRSALKGVGRAAFASVAAGVAAGDVGLLVSVALPTSRSLQRRRDRRAGGGRGGARLRRGGVRA